MHSIRRGSVTLNLASRSDESGMPSGTGDKFARFASPEFVKVNEASVSLGC